MACNLVTNLGVALIKKRWQCSVFSHTLRVAVPSPPLHLGGEGRVRVTLICKFAIIGLKVLNFDCM